MKDIQGKVTHLQCNMNLSFATLFNSSPNTLEKLNFIRHIKSNCS